MTVTADRVAARKSSTPRAGASARGPARAATVEHLSRADRSARGKDARAVAPLESQAEFAPGPGRDPVGLLLSQTASRVPELVPVRHGRMLVSPFTFYRGAALPMAADLATTPASGLRVQLCGDAHLSNFGAFASPERNLVFDVNDFDETLPGPFEWDVKRLAASLAVAARDNGFPDKAGRKIALAAAERYRTAMREFAEQTFLDVWYAHLDIEPVLKEFRSQVKAERFKEAEKLLAKAHASDSMKALDKLTTVVDGQRRIISDPPMIAPVEEIFPDVQADAIYKLLHTVLGKYRRTLQSDRRHLLEQFTMVQAARKVVGVGSVGTRAYVLLLDAADGVEPLFLAGQGGPAVGPGGVRRAQPVPQPGRAGRRRAAPAAGPERHLPRLDPRPQPPRRGGPRFLRPPAEGLEVLSADRAIAPQRHGDVRPAVRVDPGPGARPLRGPHRPGRLPRRLGQVRPGHRRLRRNLRGPERARLRRVPGRRQRRQGRSHHRHLARQPKRRSAMSALLWTVVIVWLVALAFWPARVARHKGHSWLLFFIFSLFLFLPALIMAYLVRDRRSLAGSTG